MHIFVLFIILWNVLIMYRWYAEMAEEPMVNLVCKRMMRQRFSRDWSSLLPRGLDTIYNKIHTQTQIHTGKKKGCLISSKTFAAASRTRGQKSGRMLQLNSPSPKLSLFCARIYTVNAEKGGRKKTCESIRLAEENEAGQWETVAGKSQSIQ